MRGHLSKSGPVFDDFKPPLSADGDEILKLFALKAGLRNHTEEVDQTANSQEPCSLSVLGLKIPTLCDSLCSRSSSRTESPCKGSSPREMTLEPNKYRETVELFLS